VVPIWPNENSEKAGAEVVGEGNRGEAMRSREGSLVQPGMTHGAIQEDLEREENQEGGKGQRVRRGW
jgi:hypothetical protein